MVFSANGITGGVFAAAVAGGSADEAVVTNVSTIDMGTGANDLVVLNSDDLSVNTLDFSAAWGKVSVKNFFIDGASGGTQGVHEIDFTAFLDDQNDPSADNGNALSAVRVATTDATVVAMNANTSSDTDFTTLSALDGNATNTFATITDAEVLTALQADATYAAAVAGGTLIGTSRDSMLFVENNANLGEYKVYNVTLALLAANDDTGITGVQLVGTIDFGNSVDFAVATLFAGA